MYNESWLLYWRSRSGTFLTSLQNIIHPLFLKYVASGSDDFNVYIWRVPNDDGRSKFLSFHSERNCIAPHRCISTTVYSVSPPSFRYFAFLWVGEGKESVLNRSFCVERSYDFERTSFRGEPSPIFLSFAYDCFKWRWKSDQSMIQFSLSKQTFSSSSFSVNC